MQAEQEKTEFCCEFFPVPLPIFWRVVFWIAFGVCVVNWVFPTVKKGGEKCRMVSFGVFWV